jgi:uncharacterized lipoprotein NlpE involved in copper resistance
MAGIELVLLGLLGCRKYASSKAFIGVGFFLTAVALVVVVNAIVRMVYLGHKKWMEAIASKCDIVLDANQLNNVLDEKQELD